MHLVENALQILNCNLFLANSMLYNTLVMLCSSGEMILPSCKLI